MFELGNSENLKESAKKGLIWGAGFTLARDVIQFGSMIILVRLLNPEIYGKFAIAQAMLIFLAVFSAKTITPFALQSRDPNEFDWGLQFTVGAILNAVIFLVSITVGVCLFLFGGINLSEVGLIILVICLIFPMEVISNHYFVWLQAFHNWARMRTLVLLGAVLGATASILAAICGAGVFALAIANLCFAVPLLLDYCFRRPFALGFSPKRLREYKEGREFGVNRMSSAALQSGSTLVEQSLLTNYFGFATLGVFTRSVGLAQITSGRIGPIVSQSLYPVLTRAEASSDRFKRFAHHLFRGVLWTSMPAALFIAMQAELLVSFLYGAKWLQVIPLMAAASALLAMRGLHICINQIMLGNLQHRDCLRFDLISVISMILVMITTISYGPKFYLWALALHATILIGIGLFFLSRRDGIYFARSARSVLSCCFALVFAFYIADFLQAALKASYPSLHLLLELSVIGAAFSTVYLLALRLFSPGEFLEAIESAPFPDRINKFIAKATFS